MSSVEKHSLDFAQKISDILKSSFACEIDVSKTIELGDTIVSDKCYYASILITGTQYGEYILALNKKTIAKLLEMPGVEREEAFKAELQDINGVFGEFLNIVVGIILPDLHKSAETRLTMTAPRFFVGKPVYPQVKAAKSTLTLSDGDTIECFFYMDSMKLEIAKSYQETLEKLQSNFSKLKSAHDRIASQQYQLVKAEKMASLGVLSAGVAHNLNTPLGTISMACGAVKKGIDPSANAAMKSVAAISNATSRMANIIKTLRMYSTKMTLKDTAKVSLRGLMESIVADFESSLSLELGVRVKLEISPECPEEIVCGVEELRYALQNLLQNSVEALKDIDVSERKLNVIIKNTEENIVFEVSDNGRKIDEAELSSLFDPFFTTKDSAHPGLGLAIVKGVTEAHQGRVEVVLGEEKCFKITIPKLKSGLNKDENNEGAKAA